MAEVIPQRQVTPELTTYYDGLTAEVAQQVHQVLPEAHIEHVGATAVPGLTTKGDLDIAVRVPQTSFDSAISTLGSVFQPIHEEHWIPAIHAIFNAPSQDGTEISLQLVAIGSTHDFFAQLKRRLLDHEDFRRQVNEIKATYAASGMDVYRTQKAVVYDRILAWRGSQTLDWYDFEEWTRPPSGTWVIGQVQRPDGSVMFIAGRYEEAEDIVRDASDHTWGWDTPDRVMRWAALEWPVLMSS
ncbi:GrpB family protein [Deinococcus sp. QL22]|uniref:GrpB family protein n=1 Tax=Deinococcus sp. QL22 TaxID=2939437 RepID=UPI0020179B25|nr:GrpB family protein [Deinococcus sp. QL22]UQN10651.1 GrpB family protein [Deinococcus sp. QL22]